MLRCKVITLRHCVYHLKLPSLEPKNPSSKKYNKNKNYATTPGM